MTSFTSIPTLGLDPLGNPTNLITNSSGQALVCTNANTMTLPDQAWQQTEVTVLFKSSAGIAGLGTGTDSTGKTQNLLWENQGSGWVIGPSALSQIRPYGLEYESGDWLIATGQNVLASDFMLHSPAPAGGLASSPPTYETLSSSSIPTDALNQNGSLVVATSMSSIGSWTESDTPGTWDHNVGQSTPLATGHKKTTYTFPGYSGGNAQVQYGNAVPNSDHPPVEWNVANGLEEGYFGLIGDPIYTVNWTTP